MSGLTTIVVSAAGALLLAAPTIARAQCSGESDQQARWVSRFYLGSVLSSATTEAHIADFAGRQDTIHLETDNGLGVGVDVGRRLSGLELQIGAHSTNVPLLGRSIAESNLIESDGFRFSVFTVGALYHVSEQAQFDFYFGPLLSLTSRDSARIALSGRDVIVATSGAFGAGGQFGVRWPGCVDKSTVALDLGFRFLDWRLPLSQGGRLDARPWIVSVGLIYRY